MSKSIVFTLILLLVIIIPIDAVAQCSLCTKTASQLGEKPALGLNQGIVYLMLTPFIIVAYIAYRWWKGQKAEKNSA